MDFCCPLLVFRSSNWKLQLIRLFCGQELTFLGEAVHVDCFVMDPSWPACRCSRLFCSAITSFYLTSFFHLILVEKILLGEWAKQALLRSFEVFCCWWGFFPLIFFPFLSFYALVLFRSLPVEKMELPLQWDIYLSIRILTTCGM